MGDKGNDRVAYCDPAENKYQDDNNIAHMNAPIRSLKEIATTGDLFRGTIGEVYRKERDIYQDKDSGFVHRLTSTEASSQSNCFRSVQWTGDGRYMITNSEDNAVRVFEWPQKLMDDQHSTTELKPQALYRAPEPMYVVASCPYQLADHTQNWYITAARENPIHLRSLSGEMLHTYILQHKFTEQYLTPYSITFAGTKYQFICGTDSMISVFDYHRREPVISMLTTPTKKSVHSPSTMKGIVSALSISPDRGILAAGTYSRKVALYDSEGCGSAIAIFPTASEIEVSRSAPGGVTDVKWNGCGTYIVVSERNQDTVGVWDVRKLYAKVATLKGRDAKTAQRLGIEIMHDKNGKETVIAGSKNGFVRKWSLHEDENPNWQTKICEDAIGSMARHPLQSGLLALCTGQRQSLLDRDISGVFGGRDRNNGHDSVARQNGTRMDNTLQVWQMDE